ncbi:hypothetical protein, partial [Pseudoalteromonas sp. Of7M-16]|uniref:hypothetical protein n=1 Tax=Pseudoalteromonas sp. Of7M-16 TaxID=2917756 RepID=UPI001EF723B4
DAMLLLFYCRNDYPTPNILPARWQTPSTQAPKKIDSAIGHSLILGKIAPLKFTPNNRSRIRNAKNTVATATTR